MLVFDARAAESSFLRFAVLTVNVCFEPETREIRDVVLN